MGLRDFILIFAGFGGMLAGALLPGLGEPLRHAPTACVVVLALLCFLSGLSPDKSVGATSLRGLPRFLFIKMLVLPLVCWGIFLPLFPQYALGALLLGGTAVGVLAPFFLFLLRGDEVFGTAAFIASSLLMPCTVPLVVGIAALAGDMPAAGLFTSFLHTALFLAACLLPPFLAAKGAWVFRPSLARAVLKRRYGISLFCSTGSMLVVFSRFSDPLRQDPSLIPQSLGVAFFAGALLFVLGLLFTRNEPRERRLAEVVCCCAMNNVLMAVVAARFFGVHEMLMCALYSVPFNFLLIPYRVLAARLRTGGAGA